MHDGDRSDKPATLGGFGYLTAIILCCIIVGVLAYGLGREDQRRHDTPASYAKAAKEDAKSACVGGEGSTSFECIYEKVEASQEQARGEQDLSAQQKAANAALVSAIIAFATLVVTGVGIWFVKRTLDATLDAVEDTGKATIAMQQQNALTEQAQRPWIEISAAINSIERYGNSLVVICDIVLKNIGKLPAKEVRIEQYIAESGSDPMPAFNEAAVDPIASNRMTWGNRSDFIILPNGKMTKQEILAYRRDEPGHPLEGGVWPQFMISILYTLPSGAVAQTSVGYEIDTYNGDSSAIRYLLWDSPENDDDMIVHEIGYIKAT